MTHFTFNPDTSLKAPSAEELAEADRYVEIISFLEGEDENGETEWFYLAVLPSKHTEFTRRCAMREPLALEDYARILMQGKGTPGAEQKQHMREQYGFDEHYRGKLTLAAKAQQKAFFDKKEAARLGDIVAMLKAQKQ